MLGVYENIDRHIKEPNLATVDAVLATLDCRRYIERTLDAAYREIPIKNLYVIDGGSKDGTLDVVRQYPRVNLSVQPELTHNKTMEALFQKVTTEWCVWIDNPKVMTVGWFDMMMSHRDRGDVLNSKRVMHYEFEREDTTTTDLGKRTLGGPFLMRSDAAKCFHIDNLVSARIFDVLIRQAIESNGYVYGVVPEAQVTLFASDELKYPSHPYLCGTGLVFRNPELKIWNKEGYRKRLEENVKGIVRYLDPANVRWFIDDEYMLRMNKLDRRWVMETNMKWYVELKEWRRQRFMKAMLRSMLFSYGKRLVSLVDRVFLKATEMGSQDMVKHWGKVK